MIALKEFLPDNPQDRSSITETLRLHPVSARFISRFAERIEREYPQSEIVIDNRQYDEWDPPLTMMIRLPVDRGDYASSFDAIHTKASTDRDYDDREVSLLVLRLPTHD